MWWEVVAWALLAAAALAAIARLVAWVLDDPAQVDPDVRLYIASTYCRVRERGVGSHLADVHSNLGPYCFGHLNAAIEGARSAGVPFLPAEVRDPDGEWVEL